MENRTLHKAQLYKKVQRSLGLLNAIYIRKKKKNLGTQKRIIRRWESPGAELGTFDWVGQIQKNKIIWGISPILISYILKIINNYVCYKGF